VTLVIGLTTLGSSVDAALAQGSTPQPPPPTPTPTSGDVGIPALSTLATCVRDAKQVAVVLLIDESGSLKRTDPRNRRVVAVKSALDSLAGLAEREIGGSRPVVNVSMATFASDYQTLVPWTRLGYSNLPALSTSAESLAQRNRGVDTDYAAALLGAQRALAEHQGVACRAVMWFTDGKYDIDARRNGQLPTKSYAPNARTTAELVTAGQQLICQPKGLADQLRTQHIATIALALTGGLDSADRDFLSALTIGTGGGTTCGSVDGRLTGAFLPVNNLSELVASFDSVGALLGFGVQGKPFFDVPVCIQTVCNAGTRSLPVDLGMSGVHLSAQTGGNDVSVVLHSPQATVTFAPNQTASATGTPPTGAPTVSSTPTAPVQQFTLGAAAGRAVWLAPDVVTIDITLPADSVAWSGKWSVAFVGTEKKGEVPAVAPGFRTFYYSAVTARVRTGAGANSPLAVELINHPGGSRLLPAVIAATKLSLNGATDDGATARFTTPLTASTGATFVPSASRAPVSAGKTRASSETTSTPILQVELQLTTASGIRLLPTRVKVDRPTLAPRLLNTPSRSVLTARRMLTAGATLLGVLLIGCVVLVMRHRRHTFPSMQGVQVVAQPVRIAFDAVGRHRIVWLGADGAESQFRLSTVTFERGLPTKRAKGFDIGGVHFAKNPRAGGGIATKAGVLMMTGPETESRKLSCNQDTVSVSAEFAPMWLFAGEFADLLETHPGGHTGAGGTVGTVGTLRVVRNSNLDRVFDGVMILAVNSVEQIPMLERSVLQDLPGVARQQLRSVSNAA
jgi:von Willebrand factor type A domain